MDKNTIEYSALFIFLNKTGFRGVYRKNSQNQFNVPYGHYKQIPNIPKEVLFNISDLIQNVEFKCLDFTESILKAKQGDFIYLDPPYAPENQNSFVGYTQDGFNLETHNKLFNLIHNHCNQPNKIIKFAMSNSNTQLVTDFFTNNTETNNQTNNKVNNKVNYKIKKITARRAINSKNPESKTIEVIISN